MERPRALARRTCALLLVACTGTVFSTGCAVEIEKLPKERSPRDSLGQEIFKTLCRRMAGIEMPADFDGRRSQELCMGDTAAELEARSADYPPRLVALAQRRQQLAEALDESMPGETASGLEDIMGELLPLYDAPNEYAQTGTRLTAAMLQDLAKDDAALDGLERFAREGMLSSEGDFGMLRAVLSHNDIGNFLRTVLPDLTKEETLAEPLREALAGFALELATSELETDPSSDTCHTRALMMRSEPADLGAPVFGSGKPLYATRRDVRGMPIPTRDQDAADSADLISACGVGPGQKYALPYPFVDRDNDGLADIEGPSFRLDPSFEGPLPEPYPVSGEAEAQFSRDKLGRAHALKPDGKADDAKLMYLSRNVDATVLAASLREAARLFSRDHSLLTGVAGAVPALIGDEVETTRRYEKASHTYKAADPGTSPLLGLLNATSATTADPSFDESLELSTRMLRDYERELVTSLQPVLELERRTRPGPDDAYPEAKLEPNNTFWEELGWEVEKLSRRRNVKGGETLLEAAVRGSLGWGRNFGKDNAPKELLIDPHLLGSQGSLLAMMMRYKDEWRGNPKPKSDRAADDPAIIGSLRTPVDRTKPQTPITCGRDGCGGLIAGSPFERWKKDQFHICMVQIDGRSTSGRDCGAPANQSLLHRSMGMLAELEGLSQCNRPITVRDLFDFASDGDAGDDPELENTISEAEKALSQDYVCPPDAPANAPCRAYADKYPAAFVPRPAEGGQPMPDAIQECALLDLKDAGRIFGQVLTHQYRIQVPNPWVFRYLEDVARAADSSLPACAPFTIVDPTVAQPCIPEAARLSRGVFDELRSCAPSEPDCIDTLGELIEFLLDDTELFQTERDLEELRPDARTLSRVMFTPAGASKGFQMFDPMLIKGAPPLCKKPTDSRIECDLSDPSKDDVCCVGDLVNPPVRFRIDTFYGATTYAWEHVFKLKSGEELSFLDSGKPLADAFNRFDVPAGMSPADAAAAGYEDPGYVLTKLGKMVALHYDAPDNPAAQNKDPNRAGYSKLTGLVRYEELLADLVDDGSIDLAQKAPHGIGMFQEGLTIPPERRLGMLAAGTDLLLAMDALEFRNTTNDPDQDGIRSFARGTEVMANPHAFCAGENGDARVVSGRGACDSATPARAPIAALDGRNHPCWDGGQCFDGKGGNPRRYVSSLTLLMDAAGSFYDRAKSVDGMFESARGVLTSVVEALLPIKDGLLERRRVRSLGIVMGDYMRERWAQEKAAGTLSTLGKRTTEDMVDTVTNPGVAGALHLFQALAPQEGILNAISAMAYGLLDEKSEPAASRAFLAASADAVESLPGDASSTAITRNAALALAANLDEVLNGSAKVLDIDGSLAWNNIFMMGETVLPDKNDIVTEIAGAATRARGPNTDKSGSIPVSTLMDTLLDINRVDPLQQGQHTAADYREAFNRIADVMLDKKTGFERLYALIKCSRNSKDPSCD